MSALVAPGARAERVVVFLGDSLTAWGDWSEMFPGVKTVNLGVPGDTTVRILARVEDAVRPGPDKVFIMAGANDLWHGRPPLNAVEYYRRILVSLRRSVPKATIYVQSCLPVNEELFKGFTNRTLSDLNDRLRELAKDLGLEYIDVAGPLTGADGELIGEYTRDGVHLTRAGYLAWKRAIQGYIEDSRP